MKRTVPLLFAGLAPLITWLSIGRKEFVSDQQLANHWTASGNADGFISANTAVLQSFISAAIVAVLYGTIAVLPKRHRPGSALFLLGIAAASAWVFNLSVIDSIRSTNFLSPERTPGPGVARLAIVIVLPLVSTALAIRSVASDPPPILVDSQPHIPLSSDEHAVWFASLTSVPMMVPAVLLSGATCIIAFQLRTLWMLGLVPVLAGLLALGHIKVRVDRTGLTVCFGWGSLIRMHIDVDRIAGAEPIEVSPLKWGGWGYRGSLRFMRRAAVVLRKGPGIKVSLRNGAEFAVTIDHPDEGAALLNTFARRTSAVS